MICPLPISGTWGHPTEGVCPTESHIEGRMQEMKGSDGNMCTHKGSDGIRCTHKTHLFPMGREQRLKWVPLTNLGGAFLEPVRTPGRCSVAMAAG